jgi:cell division transport system permease protein
MGNSESKIMRRRLRNAYLSSIISISLVLLLVGIASLLLVNARAISDYFKENMQVSVMMKQNVDESDALKYKEKLDQKGFIRSSVFVSREQGRREMEDMLGADFLNVFETAPIPVSIDVTLNAEYVSADSIEVVKEAIMESPMVEEVVYQKSLIDTLNANLSKISAVLSVFIVLMMFISFVLINNTVRLNVFARRFTIHTMKLVGATRAFIRAPFLVQSLFQGVFAAFVAIMAIVGLLFFVRSEFEQLFEVFRLELLLVVMGIVLASGIVICLLSTWLVVNKLVSLNKDELYY